MKRPVGRICRHEHVPEERAVLDGASVHVDFRHHPRIRRTVSREHRMPDPHAPLLGQDAGAHGVEQRVSLLQHSRHDQGYFASPKTRADAVESSSRRLAETRSLRGARPWPAMVYSDHYEMMTEP